jgi:uncharacterized membrane protein YhaH (DUF805 family)
MGQFKLGAFTLTTSPEFDKFATLRQRYMEIGQNRQLEFDEAYEEFKCADELFGELPDDMEMVLAETSAQVASDLAAHGIFDVSERSIRSDLEARAETVADRFNVIKDQYLEIVSKASELEAQRQAARENRGGIVGGGFGVEGAARGIALAAVANATIGLVQGLAHNAEKAASDAGDKRKKQQLLADPATKAAVGDFLVRVALQGAELVAATINNGGTFEPVSEQARQRSAAIVENVMAGRVASDQLSSVLVQALTLDPFSVEAWACWLERLGDQDGSVQASATQLGVGDVAARKVALIAQRKAALPWATPEECRSSSIVLKKYAQWLGAAFDEEERAIEAKITTLDRERRTFNGIEYETADDADAARKAHQEEQASAELARQDLLSRTVDGAVFDTLEEAEAVREHMRTQIISASSASSAIGWMILAYRRIRDVKGRSSRKEFWFLVLSIFITLVSSGIVENTIFRQTFLFALIMVIYMLAAAFAFLTAQIRRFHDQGRSGWFVLLNLIPYVGWLIALAFMLVDGTPGDNRFGPSPKHS